MMPVLVAMSGPVAARAIEQFQRCAVAAARARHAIEPRHGLDVVIEHVRAGVEHRAQRRLDALEVGNQHLDAARRARARASARIVSAKMNAPPSARSSRSTEVITANCRPMRATASATRAGSAVSSSFGRAVRHGAVGAGARADVAEDHERRRAVVPALADVGAARVLAHGVQLQVLHDPLEPEVVVRPGRADLQPVGLGLARADELEGGFDGHLS